MTDTKNLQSAYDLAKERYAAFGVDPEKAIANLENVSVSLHCWQGDDVGGFEIPAATSLEELLPREIIPAKHAMRTNCAKIWT